MLRHVGALITGLQSIDIKTLLKKFKDASSFDGNEKDHPTEG